MKSTHCETLRLLLAAALVACPLLAHAQSAVGPSFLGVINGDFEQAIADTVLTANVSLPSNPAYPYNFTDAYTLTVNSPFNLSGLVASLNVGASYDIANLEVGVFNGTTLTDYLGNTQTGPGQFDNFTGSASGAVSGLGWEGGSNSLTFASASPIGPGTYTVEIRGDVTGSVSGQYVGQIGITMAVPEISSAAMMIAGLAAVGSVVVLRRARRG